jgi:hypothetical protein
MFDAGLRSLFPLGVFRDSLADGTTTLSVEEALEYLRDNQ